MHGAAVGILGWVVLFLEAVGKESPFIATLRFKKKKLSIVFDFPLQDGRCKKKKKKN